MKDHHYHIKNIWTGNKGAGTRSYDVYSRDHVISINGKSDILSSSDPAFRGDPARHNPEELLVASLSSCHMLWYLHLCAVNHVNILSYEDHAEGIMTETPDGGGKFKVVTLKPQIVIEDAKMKEKALKLHREANQKCFIANSCNFPIFHEPIILIQE